MVKALGLIHLCRVLIVVKKPLIATNESAAPTCVGGGPAVSKRHLDCKRVSTKLFTLRQPPNLPTRSIGEYCPWAAYSCALAGLPSFRETETTSSITASVGVVRRIACL